MVSPRLWLPVLATLVLGGCSLVVEFDRSLLLDGGPDGGGASVDAGVDGVVDGGASAGGATDDGGDGG